MIHVFVLTAIIIVSTVIISDLFILYWLIFCEMAGRMKTHVLLTNDY